jgi:hypothetical protein
MFHIFQLVVIVEILGVNLIFKYFIVHIALPLASMYMGGGGYLMNYLCQYR